MSAFEGNIEAFLGVWFRALEFFCSARMATRIWQEIPFLYALPLVDSYFYSLNAAS